MRFAIYVKGERGLRSLTGLVKRRLMPAICVSEKSDRTISALCRRYRIRYLMEGSPGRKEHLSLMRRLKPDLIVAAGYSRILPEALFSGLRFGAVNCHGGKLPEYRGASPIPWQIINGETSGAAYVLKMTKGVDDGPILAQEPYGIGADETARHITDKVSAIFERLIPEVVERYAKDDPPEEAPQDGKNACRWTRRKPEDGLIRWGDLTVRQAVDLVRALDDPYPGAFIMCKGEPLIIRRARPYIRKVMGIPGRFVGRTEDGCLILAKDGAVEILEFARKGKAFPGVRFPASYGETF